MSTIKSKVLAACATLTLVSGVGAAGAITAGTASAGTPSCGPTCINTFPKEYSGATLKNPGFVIDVLKQGEKIGQPIILFRTANFDPAEDWTLAFQGKVSDFFAAGLVSSAVALHYGCTMPAFPTCAASVNDDAWENEYAPFGVDSGLCLGVAATAFAGEGVTLQPCGVSSRAVWIEDTNPGDFPAPPYYAAINGSDTNFSQPFVLDYPSSGYPTDKPRPQLYVTNLTGFSASADNDDQLWTGFAGILP